MTPSGPRTIDIQSDSTNLNPRLKSPTNDDTNYSYIENERINKILSERNVNVSELIQQKKMTEGDYNYKPLNRNKTQEGMFLGVNSPT